ncbi:MAG: hypothetical protein IKK15_01350, partial [Akkermansia sp.]|nr:hypothetical protein [Akkermansia sp.]
SPLNRGSYLFVRFPGVPPLTRLHRRATIYRPSGALISAGIRPQGIPYKLPFIEFLEMPKLPFIEFFEVPTM